MKRRKRRIRATSQRRRIRLDPALPPPGSRRLQATIKPILQVHIISHLSFSSRPSHALVADSDDDDDADSDDSNSDPEANERRMTREERMRAITKIRVSRDDQIENPRTGKIKSW